MYLAVLVSTDKLTYFSAEQEQDDFADRSPLLLCKSLHFFFARKHCVSIRIPTVFLPRVDVEIFTQQRLISGVCATKIIP